MGVAAVGGQVYAVGGFDGTGQPVATVESYSLADNRWTQRADIPTPREAAPRQRSPGGWW